MTDLKLRRLGFIIICLGHVSSLCDHNLARGAFRHAHDEGRAQNHGGIRLGIGAPCQNTKKKNKKKHGDRLGYYVLAV